MGMPAAVSVLAEQLLVNHNISGASALSVGQQIQLIPCKCQVVVRAELLPSSTLYWSH